MINNKMELIKEISETAQKAKIQYKKLELPRGSLLIEEVAKRFTLDLTIRYIWESLPPKIASVYVYDTNTWQSLFSNMLSHFLSSVYLVVTDDDFYPWQVFEFEKKDILAILDELPYFEFFIFDNSMNSLLFDTHGNEIYMAVFPKIAKHNKNGA